MSQTDTRSVGELEGQVGELDSVPPAALDADERARLVDALVALADAYGSRGDVNAEADALETLERLHQAHPDADVDVHLATALANATAVRERADVYETTIRPDRIDDYRERVNSLYTARSVPALAAPLARATVGAIHANAKAERLERVEPLLARLESLYETHTDPDIAASLLFGYAHAERYLDGLDGDEAPTSGPGPGSASGQDRDQDRDRDQDQDRLDRAATLFETHPDADVAAAYAGVLAGRTNRDVEREAIEAIESRVARIKALAQGYPAREEAIVSWLPMARCAKRSCLPSCAPRNPFPMTRLNHRWKARALLGIDPPTRPLRTMQSARVRRGESANYRMASTSLCRPGNNCLAAM